MIENLITLGLLILLQAVLGFDHLLYISFDSILFVVGIMLVTEGGHLAHLELFGNEITPMTKTTFYFVIGILVLTDVVQGRYQKRLLAKAGKVAPTPAA